MHELEKDIEAELRRTVERHGGMCLKWVCPGWSGVPDRIILIPGGRAMFVETKRPKGGRIGAMQKWWKNKLEKLGFIHLYVHSDKDTANVARCIFMAELDKKLRDQAKTGKG